MLQALACGTIVYENRNQIDYGPNPKPDFDVVRDESFNQLFDGLRKGMNVQATFEGRFEAVYSWQNHKQIWIGGTEGKSKGFAKKHQYGGRIVLRRVSDVLARRVPRH